MSTAIGFFTPGGPEVLRTIEVAEPRPGPGEVRVRVEAAGVQPYDIAVVQGWVPQGVDPTFPRIPGNEFAGVVDRVGAGVTGFGPGDEVLGYGRLGCYAQYVVVPSEQIAAKPADMPWAVAGGFPAGALNAHVALGELGVDHGETLLIHGAAGAVGTVAVQLARVWGVTVIAAARAPHHEYLRSLGALPIAYGDDFVHRVRALAPDGVDAVLDGVGGTALDASLELVHDRGRILTLVDHARAAALGVRLTVDKRSAARLTELADLYARGELAIHVRKTFPMSRAGDAHRAHLAGNNRGKIVLVRDR